MKTQTQTQADDPVVYRVAFYDSVDMFQVRDNTGKQVGIYYTLNEAKMYAQFAMQAYKAYNRPIAGAWSIVKTRVVQTMDVEAPTHNDITEIISDFVNAGGVL